MADNFELVTEIRPRDPEGRDDFSEDEVSIWATNTLLTLTWCEDTGEGNKKRLKRLDFTYEEFNRMAAMVDRARQMANIAGATL